ncbi:histone deacetylase family protein [Frigidibacter sp. ROC022]|uniref:histone deacetylase family protein n=1 Tax=Frigidibacter sp. ROC022 TaxID=2971796 RepID=UPI00215B017E|nr:histone deacetylase family protein [Frigidibacter sp. ROC022]MCR8724739.1 histone deacetylase family protein [Frigidibacter sp. ROC022]
MTTTWYSHEDCHQHLMPEGHPERVARLEAVTAGLAPLELSRIPAPLAAESEILRCHPQRYLDRIRASIPKQGLAALDGDTFLSPGSLTAALRAIGGCNAAVDAVLSGRALNAFSGCRPPGHHAEAETPMGFCLFGTAAIAAKYALDHHGLERVAIVDFDVHHGNGTQALLWDEPRVLFCSSHQMPLFPGTGAASETGAHGQIVNAPLSPGSDGEAMRKVYEREILPAVDGFAPELILISAGFDAHEADPLANLDWIEDDFAWITEALAGLADIHCGGRMVSTLEGGYDLPALAASVAAHVGVMKERGA